jgi:hypothetical protein
MNKLLRTKVQISDCHSEKRRSNSRPKRRATGPRLSSWRRVDKVALARVLSQIIPPMLNDHRGYIILATDGVVKQHT